MADEDIVHGFVGPILDGPPSPPDLVMLAQACAARRAEFHQAKVDAKAAADASVAAAASEASAHKAYDDSVAALIALLTSEVT